MWFRTRMVYLYYISCFRYTILVGNPRYTKQTQILTEIYKACIYRKTYIEIIIIIKKNDEVGRQS